MKNISRRVFIKGLAVAGVAAAASTVLAGCNTNMIPGVDDGADDGTVEEVPTTNQSHTYTVPNTDGKQTLTVTATGLTVLKEAKVAAVSFKIENKTEKTFKFNTATGTGALYVKQNGTKIVFDDNDSKTGAINTALSATGNNMAGSGNASGFVKGTHNVCLYIDLNSTLGNDWSKMKVTLPIQEGKSGGTGDYVVSTMEFTFENK